jgi:hypothetical protein
LRTPSRHDFCIFLPSAIIILTVPHHNISTISFDLDYGDDDVANPFLLLSMPPGDENDSRRLAFDWCHWFWLVVSVCGESTISSVMIDVEPRCDDASDVNIVSRYCYCLSDPREKLSIMMN